MKKNKLELHNYGQALDLLVLAKLNASRRFHTQPINLVVLKGSYQLTLWEILSWRRLHA